VTNHQVQRSGVPWIPIIIIGLAIILTGLALWFFLLRGRGTAEGPPPPAGESEAPVIRAAESSPTATAAAQAPAQSGQAPGRPAQTPAQPAQAPAQPVQAAPQPAQAPARPAQAASLPAQAPARPAQAAPQPAQAPARARTSPPVASYRAPPVIPPEGVLYTIRWGDTLWDIAAAFYRNPWLYTRIARYNNIADPDHIVSGTSLRILPK
jgi:nucleoid-associated protein YgaU